MFLASRSKGLSFKLNFFFILIYFIFEILVFLYSFEASPFFLFERTYRLFIISLVSVAFYLFCLGLKMLIILEDIFLDPI